MYAGRNKKKIIDVLRDFRSSVGSFMFKTLRVILANAN